MTRVALLDRDGTIAVERNYLSRVEDVALLPGAAAGLRRLREAGFRLVVVTNQSGIGRGYFDLATLEAIHARLTALLAAEGVTLDGLFFCPHLPDDGCACRKPRTGLVERAAHALGFRVEECAVIGDNVCDVDLARALGVPAVLVRTGYGAALEREGRVEADAVVDDLVGAAEHLTASGGAS